MAAPLAYEDVRAAIVAEGSDARVEVNQRALIDKILARYASAGAVYRELLQNSNDAEATTAEIIITTSHVSEKGKANSSAKVTQIIYRNNGLPFRPQDWDRLRKIAEGNPDETKIGAFGVGAYTMFSICEEPLVVSGKRGQEQAMFFFWKGDGLWTKTGRAPEGILNMSECLGYEKDGNNNWTSFILPSRDPYPLPDLVEFGQFLTASLTFTQCLRNIKVYVNNILQMNIQKTILESHTITTPKASSWWKNDGAVSTSSTGMFTLGKAEQLTQTSLLVTVSLRQSLDSSSEMETSNVRARYASALVKTKIPLDVEKRMIRVTKKNPPKELTLQIFLDAADSHDQESIQTPKNKQQSRVRLITGSFSPTPGSGRIFIGFRTSQTTGLGIHLSAPLMPTVEREAIDFVDPALRAYNSELLEISGILMRLSLEHEMGRVGVMWEEMKGERELWEAKRKERHELKEASKSFGTDDEEKTIDTQSMLDNEHTTIQTSLFSFAYYMARGVKSAVVDVVKAVPEILGEDSETTELLNPSDDRPLSLEERDAIILMKAYCPRVSTPDSLVGQCLARGFSRCLPNSSPPVLTMAGIARGNNARLCHHGIEAFGITNVVRRVLLENAKEYHTVIAACPAVTMNDLIETIQNRTLSEKELIRLLKWWPKICKIDQHAGRYGVLLKESICYSTTESESHARPSSKVCSLESIIYYTSDKLIKELPLPDAAFPSELQKLVGLRNLEDKSFSQWFSPLPFDIWASFISCHPSLTKASYDDHKTRLLVLVALSKHYDALESTNSKRIYINLLPTTTFFLPIETRDKNGSNKVQHPSETYLSSSDFSAFEGIGTFEKVSSELIKLGVSDEFLLALGVRKTVSMEFLFLHLDTLRWSSNPKSLIDYLMKADLSQQDLHKLRCTKYLPARGDKETLYSPRELYMPNNELNMFSFIQFLQWPEGETMSTAQRNFLTKTLGLRNDPPLSSVMSYLQSESEKSRESTDDVCFKLALQYLTQKLGPNGLYDDRDFVRYRNTRFLPCIRQNFETGDIIKEIKSTSECFYNPSALVMGFSVLDPELDTVAIATRTKVLKDPPIELLIKRLTQFVNVSKQKLEASQTDEDKLITKILTLFEGIFIYLSSRTSDFDKSHLRSLSKMAFIPCKYRGSLVFYRASQVFFKGNGSDSLAESLFKEVDYNTFLSLAGVKAEPTLHELFDLMLKKPDEVLDSLGEAKYKTLLRRLATDPPFQKVSDEMRNCAFLLGYLVIDDEISSAEQDGDKIQKAQFVLARAQDVFIIDNSFLRRQFSMLVSPMEQQLEEFYNMLGSRYVSEVVNRDYEVNGRVQRGIPLTTQFASRVSERRPLLLSPSVSSRPLAPNAAKLLSDENLDIVAVDSINARYTFERSSKSIPTTSCAKFIDNRTTIFITHNFDWFDVGTSIGSLILQRCQLEDSFFLSSIMEASLQTLRHRGFPVDRILQPVIAPPPSPSPESKPVDRENEHIEGDRPLGGFDSILSQMFPKCPLDIIQSMLGDNPDKEKASQVATELSSMNFSDKQGPSSHGAEDDIKTQNRQQSSDKSSTKKSGLFGRVMNGLAAGGSKRSSSSKRAVHQQALEPSRGQSNTGSLRQDDATSQHSFETMLRDSVQSTRSVQAAGVSAPETLLKLLPEGLECGSEGCEVIPQQNIIPFKGPHGTNETKNGIRVFNSRHASNSFLTNEFDSVDRFAEVIEHLTSVFKLNLSQVAIFYDPKGNTIAFNSNKSLYFNVRFFANLHRSSIDSACYSYWFTVTGHELAHNLVTAHNKEHGKFTESIIALYLPDFVNLLTKLSKHH